MSECKCNCTCDVCRHCREKVKSDVRYINWHEVSTGHIDGTDQWGDRWDIDSRSVSHGALLRMGKATNPDILEYFPSIEKAKETAEFINNNRASWIGRNMGGRIET